jgi:hypothetical protein
MEKREIEEQEKRVCGVKLLKKMKGAVGTRALKPQFVITYVLEVALDVHFFHV